MDDRSTTDAWPEGPGDPWDAVVEVLRDRVTAEVRGPGTTGLHLAAAHGARPLLVATSRPFPAGAHTGPLVELAALALLLDADRLAVGVTGRAWAADDPVPPVGDGGDRRQWVLCVHAADAHAVEAPVPRDVLVPFARDAGGVRWQEPVELALADGWLPGALAALLAGRRGVDPSTTGPAGQLERCLALGHDVTLTEHALGRLAASTVA